MDAVRGIAPPGAGLCRYVKPYWRRREVAKGDLDSGAKARGVGAFALTPQLGRGVEVNENA
ncbi:hypothetical protein QQ39_00195 [Pragia fontium]|nr:hypothetical protein QQ39_00195 [Pragia fontium]